MKDVDSRFGQPRNAADPQKELSHASDEAFNDMTRDLRKSFSEMFAFSEQVSDKCTAFAAGLFPEVAQKHTREIEDAAHQAIEKGNVDAARHLLKRDISFAGWVMGYDNSQVESLRQQLSNLQGAPAGNTSPADAQRTSSTDSSTTKTGAFQSHSTQKINSFEDLLKRQ